MQRLRKILGIVLCCSFVPLPLPAQGSGAMLYATGQVTVNGHAAASTSAIFPGDSIRVGPNGSATISAQGMSTQVQQNSELVLQSQSIEFQNGSVTVAARAPWQIHFGTTTVSMGQEMSKVDVTQREDVALVKLQEGSATLNEGGQTTALKAGFTVARPHALATEAASTSSGPAISPTHGSHLGIIAVVVGGGAAAGIGLALKGHGSTQTPISPSAP